MAAPRMKIRLVIIALFKNHPYVSRNSPAIRSQMMLLGPAPSVLVRTGGPEKLSAKPGMVSILRHSTDNRH